MATGDSARAVTMTRIRLALRRATGHWIDVETLLGDPASAAASFAQWRTLNSADLNALCDRYLRGAR